MILHHNAEFLVLLTGASETRLFSVNRDNKSKPMLRVHVCETERKTAQLTDIPI